MMVLLKEKQSQQFFRFDTRTGVLKIGYKKGKKTTAFSLSVKSRDTLMSMVDYPVMETSYLRITKIHSISICNISCLYGICNYEILERG